LGRGGGRSEKCKASNGNLRGRKKEGKVLGYEKKPLIEEAWLRSDSSREELGRDYFSIFRREGGTKSGKEAKIGAVSQGGEVRGD